MRNQHVRFLSKINKISLHLLAIDSLVNAVKPTDFGAPATGASSNYFDMPMPMDQVRVEVNQVFDVYQSGITVNSCALFRRNIGTPK